ncbi:GIY-YIG nuclease family protein [Aeromonas cavernicola]|uniref:GIY-YIG domain-containing protein n=1 Tax=Aeromonas cavernicola TaxID=1006623 RepID=A0A2H9U439_9GAMM|nr:GIY-YIG nuclease family protein [Aeromonas cavernicola]PJG58774.1 hypothetical protein CUC53_10705 [Aeromonas cavernicola]
MRKSTSENVTVTLLRPWFIYMVRTATGLLYTGISTDPMRRLGQHQRGKGARALRGKGPLQLVWQQQVSDQRTALRLEYQLKRQPKAFKEQLVQYPTLWQERDLATTLLCSITQ